LTRRTAVRAAGGRQIPWLPIGVAAGVVAVVALLAYVIVQANSGSSNANAAVKAAADESSSIPGTFVPDQGRGHLSGGYTPGRPQMPFCPAVARSTSADAPPSVTPNASTAPATSTPVPSSTPTTNPTTGNSTPNGTPTVPTDCRLANPPTSGKHLNVQQNVDVGGGNLIKIPPDPDVYPSDIQIPRDAIPHILEHAGVFIGYHCADGDDACQKVVDDMTDVVNDRIDNHKERLVMANDSDLPEGTIGLSSWNRVEDFDYKDYTRDRVVTFVSKNSCRVDFEGFCK
jgi:hypothetical protein